MPETPTKLVVDVSTGEKTTVDLNAMRVTVCDMVKDISLVQT